MLIFSLSWKHPQEFVRRCRVVKRHKICSQRCERTTKELTASAPSAVKIKVVPPPDGIILTIGAKTLPLRGSVVLVEDQRAPRRKHDHNCGRQTPPLRGSAVLVEDQRAPRRKHDHNCGRQTPPLRGSAVPAAECLFCTDNTSNDPCSRCKCETIWLQMKLTITEFRLTTSAQLDYKIQKERTLHLVLRLRGETERQDARHQ